MRPCLAADRPVRLWLRALVDRYEAARLHDLYYWNQLRELEGAEREVQDIFAEVGMVLAQLMQVEHGMNAVIGAGRDAATGRPEAQRHLTFGKARLRLEEVVRERCPEGLFESQLAILESAHVLRNHLVHGEVDVVMGSAGSPHEGQVLEVFWLDGARTEALDVGGTRVLAENALDALVEIMAALELP